MKPNNIYLTSFCKDKSIETYYLGLIACLFGSNCQAFWVQMLYFVLCWQQSCCLVWILMN